MKKVVIYSNFEKKTYDFKKHEKFSDSIIIGENEVKEFTIDFSEDVKFNMQKDTIVCYLNKPVEIAGVIAILYEEHREVFRISGMDKILISRHKFSDIDINLEKNKLIPKSFYIKITPRTKGYNQTHIVEFLEGFPAYLNNGLIKGSVSIKRGDHIDFYGLKIIIDRDKLTIYDNLRIIRKRNILSVRVNSRSSKKCYEYKRSPRIIYPVPVEKIKIATPPAEPTKPTEGIIKLILPPLLTAGVTLLLGIFMNRGLFMIIGIVATIVTTVNSVSSYISKLKTYKYETIRRKERFGKYLDNKIIEIKKQLDVQYFSLEYHYPNNDTILKMLEGDTRRLYEKTPGSHDFLTVRLGRTYTKPSFTIDYSEPEFKENDDPLLDRARAIKYRFDMNALLPLHINLGECAVGLLGNPINIKNNLLAIVNQIAFFQSYHDVEIFHIYSEEERDFWKEIRFLPHYNSKTINALAHIYSDKTRDQLLASFFQILQSREAAYKEKSSGDTLAFEPYLIVIISNMKLVIDHSINEFLSRDITHLGVSVIILDNDIKNLPEYVKTIVKYNNLDKGVLLLTNGKYTNKEFDIDKFAPDFKNDRISRIISGYEHVKTSSRGIPKQVGFLEMLNIKEVSEYPILEKWINNHPYKTLAVPLGFRGNDDVIELNLHEKAHGPHGLVAGTTGSGKSEIIQSYILGLCMNFHPYDVGLLLIDYKGGGMANLFKDLPHLLGTITNLDGAGTMRAMTAIKAELLRRQKVFGENEVNHIDGYQKLFNEGKVNVPMPHIFMISDEFAELKSEQPEFMKELVSTARIGRSLGVHLILATQKPSGVVDDQIWSNSKFKICLKVQTKADSNEMLKTADAAAITIPGRAYLQVGNNEIYELFQSAYSGGKYKGKEDGEVDKRIYVHNDLGQRQLISSDLSQGSDYSESMTELEVVIKEIKNKAELLNLSPVPRPWLPPLEERIFLEDYEHIVMNKDIKDERDQENTDVDMASGVVELSKEDKLAAYIGETDEPQNQIKDILILNPQKGVIGIFGAPGYGKSTLIQTFIMSLVRKNTPSELNFFILDFGQGLLPLRKLPHIIDYISVDEKEKILKLIVVINKEIAVRKKLFKAVGVADIDTYEKQTSKCLIRISVILDNFDAVRDLGLGDGFDSMIGILSREATSLGIYLLVGANRTGSIRYNILANFKQKVTLFHTDKTDVSAVLGRNSISIEDVLGRGATYKDGEVFTFQGFLPVRGDDTAEITLALRDEVDLIDSNWKGERPESIPIMPEELTNERFNKFKSVTKIKSESRIFSLGIDYKDVKSVNFDFTKNQILYIGASNKVTRLSTLNFLIAQSLEKGKVGIIDYKSPVLEDIKDRDIDKVDFEYASQNNDVHQLLNKFIKIYQNGLEGQKNSEVNTLIITTFVDLISIINDKDFDEFCDFLEFGYKYNINIIIMNGCEKYSQILGRAKEIIRGLEVSIHNSKMAEVPGMKIIQKTYLEPEIMKDEFNYFEEGYFKKIRIPN